VNARLVVMMSIATIAFGAFGACSLNPQPLPPLAADGAVNADVVAAFDDSGKGAPDGAGEAPDASLGFDAQPDALDADANEAAEDAPEDAPKDATETDALEADASDD